MSDASRMQYLYLASELSAAGMTAGTINAIRFTVTDLGGYVGPNSAVDNLTIKIGTTATASLSSSAWEPNTQAVYAISSHLPTLGANSFAFNTPFYWNGVDNIIIELCTDGNSSTHSANPFVTNTTGLSFNGSHTNTSDWNGGICDKTTGSATGDHPNRRQGNNQQSFGLLE
jgi:hypothetical protein